MQALSFTGSRLLAVLEDATAKEKYSQLLGDLECTRSNISGSVFDFSETNWTVLQLEVSRCT